MKFAAFSLFALFAFGLAGNPFKPEMICPICEFGVQVIQDTLGENLEKDTNKLVADCDKVFGKDPNDPSLWNLICDAVLKDVLDEIVKILEDEQTQIKDAKAICKAVNLCPTDSGSP